MTSKHAVYFATGSNEWLDLTALGSGRYRLEESSLLNDSLNLGDVIVGAHLDNGGIRFLCVSQKSSYVTWRWLLPKDVAESISLANFLKWIRRAGGLSEQALGGFLILHLPEGSPFDADIEFRRQVDLPGRLKLRGCGRRWSDRVVLLAEALPLLATELEQRLREKRQIEVAGQLPQIQIVDRCRCGDDFCSSFYTQPVFGSIHDIQKALWPPHRWVKLEAARGSLTVDLEWEIIAQVKVLHREDIRNALIAALP